MLRITRGAVAVVLLAAALVQAPASVAASSITPLGTNLVRNPGAEAGPGGDGYHKKLAPHWSAAAATDPFTVVHYGAPGFPTHREATRIGGGSNFFGCGDQVSFGDTVGILHQVIALRGRHAAIDGGSIKVIMRGWVATWSDDDFGHLGMDALDAAGHPLDDGHASTQASHTDSLFVNVHGSFVLPPHTRQLSLLLVGHRLQGNYCDAYFDNVSVKLVHV